MPGFTELISTVEQQRQNQQTLQQQEARQLAVRPGVNTEALAQDAGRRFREGGALSIGRQRNELFQDAIDFQDSQIPIARGLAIADVGLSGLSVFGDFKQRQLNAAAADRFEARQNETLDLLRAQAREKIDSSRTRTQLLIDESRRLALGRKGEEGGSASVFSPGLEGSQIDPTEFDEPGLFRQPSIAENEAGRFSMLLPPQPTPRGSEFGFTPPALPKTEGLDFHSLRRSPVTSPAERIPGQIQAAPAITRETGGGFTSMRESSDSGLAGFSLEEVANIKDASGRISQGQTITPQQQSLIQRFRRQNTRALSPRF